MTQTRVPSNQHEIKEEVPDVTYNIEKIGLQRQGTTLQGPDSVAFQLFLTQNHTMTLNFLKQQKLFGCAIPIEPLKCFQCANFETHNLAHLTYHFKAKHTLPQWQEKLYMCGSCSFQTDSSYLFLRHRLLNTCIRDAEVKKSETSIPEGTEESPSEKMTDGRVESVENESFRKSSPKTDQKSQKCPHCPFKTHYKQSLQNHVLSKHTDRAQWLKCAQCSYRSKTKSNLQKHVGYKHDNKHRLQCAHCPFVTRYKYLLSRHNITKHTELAKIRFYECMFCSCQYRTKSLLKAHVAYKHGNMTSLRCEEAQCPFETKSKQTLKNHVLSKHTAPEEIQWLACAQCAYKSKTSPNLKNHVSRTHGDQKYLQCEHCEFRTKASVTLRSHVLMKHTDPERVEWLYCGYCAYKTRMEVYLQRHFAQHHTREDTV